MEQKTTLRFPLSLMTSTKRHLLRPRVYALALILSLAAVGTIAACGGGEPEIRGQVGRTLEIHIRPVEIVEKLAFVDLDGQHRVMRPKASNRLLALVRVTIVNRTSTVIPLLVDSDAAQLGDRKTDRIDASNPFEVAKFLDSADPEENKYVPLLWGEFELGRNFQVEGWMVFDVPKGLSLGTVWWGEVDNMVVDYEPRS
jgi:hypothetical protein